MNMQRQGLAGYALVTLTDREQAQAAVIEVNGRIFMNRPLIVRLVYGPKSSHPAPTSAVIAPEGPKNLTPQAEGRRLHVGNLAYEATEAELETFFYGYGLENVEIPLNPRNNHPLGYALVDLRSADEAEKAIVDLSGTEILGRKVSVQLARDPEYSKKGSEVVSSDESPGPPASRRRPSLSQEQVVSCAQYLLVSYSTAQLPRFLEEIRLIWDHEVRFKLKHWVPILAAVTEGAGDKNVPLRLKPWFAIANATRRQTGKAPLSFYFMEGRATQDWYVSGLHVTCPKLTSTQSRLHR